MNEFVNRMAVQREILAIVNAREWDENLFGLSQSAISRWQAINHIPPDAVELQLIVSASQALSFLATKSQDQISAEYERVSNDARAAARALRGHFERAAPVG
jgi:hypothetical protein